MLQYKQKASYIRLPVYKEKIIWQQTLKTKTIPINKKEKIKNKEKRMEIIETIHIQLRKRVETKWQRTTGAFQQW